MIAANANLQSSNQRPIPLRCRVDLQNQPVQYLGVDYQVVKDPVGLQYHRLQPEQYCALQLLNGERSLEQIRDGIRAEYPTVHLTLSDVQQLITDLHKKGLVQTDRAGQGRSLVRERKKQKNEKFWQQARSLLYFRLPGWDPEVTLELMYPFVKWLFNPVVVFFCMLFVMSSWLLLLVNFDAFRSALPEFQSFFSWPNLLYMWITLGTAKVIHEFGHGLSCKHYGGECHEMGVMLLVFSPCLYCDVTDSWMLRNKWHRIIIAAAGMYIEVILSAIAIFVWYNTKPGLVHHLALNTFFVTTITTVIFNANPLMRFDGYYMMSDFLEIPNLRPKADKLLRESFGWYCLGIEARPDPFMPETGKAWFVTYAIAAWLYRWVILFSISLFLYTVLKPYDLQALGVVLLCVSMSGIFYSMIKNTYQMITAPRIEPLSKPKMTITFLIFAGVVAAIMAIPIPWYIEAPLVLEPQDVTHMMATTPGRMLTPEEIEERRGDEFSVASKVPTGEYPRRIKAGDIVQKDQILAVVENREKAIQRQELATQAKIVEAQVEHYRQPSQREYEKERMALRQLEGINEQIALLDEQLANRIIRATADGVVVAPPPVPEPKLDDTNRTDLSNWYGTPLDERNANCFLEPNSHLLSIAPNENFQAVLYVDQGDRNDVHKDDRVRVKLEDLPGEIYETTVAKMSPQADFFAPEPLSTKYGGSMGTVPSEDGGRERLVSYAYRATAVINQDVDLMRSGMRGMGRFVMGERSLWDWGWRYIRKQLHFRL